MNTKKHQDRSEQVEELLAACGRAQSWQEFCNRLRTVTFPEPADILEALNRWRNYALHFRRWHREHDVDGRVRLDLQQMAVEDAIINAAKRRGLAVASIRRVGRLLVEILDEHPNLADTIYGWPDEDFRESLTNPADAAVLSEAVDVLAELEATLLLEASDAPDTTTADALRACDELDLAILQVLASQAGTTKQAELQAKLTARSVRRSLRTIRTRLKQLRECGLTEQLLRQGERITDFGTRALMDAAKLPVDCR